MKRARNRPIDPAAAVGTLFQLPDPEPLRPKIKNPRSPVWTGNKAKLIERYLYYFVMITKGGIYIDGFAGPQDPDKPETWAAKRVLESQPRWLNEFHLFEKDQDQITALEQLRHDQPPRNRERGEPKRRIRIYPGDFNETLPTALRSGAIKRSRATFCLLDQRTFECHWGTLKGLAEHKPSVSKIELFYFLPNAWFHRAMAAVRDRGILDAWWGRDDWASLQELRGVERAYLISTRFRREFGYWSAEPWAIYERPDGGRVMYYMIHATDHVAAPGLMARAYHRAVLPKEPPDQVMLELGL